jgi:hypothetical protein
MSKYIIYLVFQRSNIVFLSQICITKVSNAYTFSIGIFFTRVVLHEEAPEMQCFVLNICGQLKHFCNRYTPPKVSIL